MWPSPNWESDTYLHDRVSEVNASIPCENGQVSLQAGKTDSPPTLEIDVFPQWEIAYTLNIENITRTETMGYVSTYEDAVSLIQSYVDTIVSERSEGETLDALDVKLQLDNLSPSESEPMIVGTDDYRSKGENERKRERKENRSKSSRTPL